jgi:hypothetical protein
MVYLLYFVNIKKNDAKYTNFVAYNAKFTIIHSQYLLPKEALLILT